MQLRHLGAALALALVATPAAARDTTSRACLTPATRQILEAAEAHFGVTFRLVSTCRPGAVIAGTRDPSQHRYGRAVDLVVPQGTAKASVVRWLFAHARGVVMTYRNMAHVHFDTGRYHKLVRGADAYGGHRTARAGRHRHQAAAADRAAAPWSASWPPPG